MNSLSKVLIKILISLMSFIIAIGIGILSINIYMVNKTKKKILDINNLEDTHDFDCILVLGAGVWGDRPSPLLEDRIIKGIELYEQGISQKILMTGDHGHKDYDEVNVMKNYAIDKGIRSEDIFMDHAGFSTYDSLYRAKEIFEAEKIIIVSQSYHLYRALYIGQALGLDVYGFSADLRKYKEQIRWDIREALARTKDFFKVIIKPEPKYLGEPIPIKGDGNVTNDK